MTARHWILCRVIGITILAALIALAAVLPLSPELTQAQGGGPTVADVAVTSSPASGDTYLLGETIRVSVTFSESVEVDTAGGTPRLKIDMDRADWGQKWAGYHSGSGTNTLSFTHTVVRPNYSTQGVAVLANSLELNGGTIRSSASQTDADLSHRERDHNASHKVDWQRTSPTPTPTPSPAPTSEPTPAPTPSVTNVAISSTPASGDTYGGGETIRVVCCLQRVCGRGHDGRNAPPEDRHGPRRLGREVGSLRGRQRHNHPHLHPHGREAQLLHSGRRRARQLPGTERRGRSGRRRRRRTPTCPTTGSPTPLSTRWTGNWCPTMPRWWTLSHTTTQSSPPWPRGTGTRRGGRSTPATPPGASWLASPSTASSQTLTETKLSYTVSAAEEQSQLVEDLRVTRDEGMRERQEWLRDEPVGKYDRVWLLMDGDADWKSVEPALADPLIVRVTLTATDPGGLSASVEGVFRTDWVSEPELVSAASDGASVELTYDLELDGGVCGLLPTSSR